MQRKTEVMRVVRVPPLGKLVVVIGEETFENLNEISNPVQRRQVLAAVGELVSFVNGYDAMADAGYAPSRTPIGQGREEEPLTPEQERFLAELQKRPGASVELPIEPSPAAATEPTAPPPAPPETAPAPPATTPASPEEEPHAPPGSIAAQINGILAQHLARAEDLQGRDVHLEQTEAGGLRIMVDGRAYTRPGEIEDRRVQFVLRQALKEWDQT
jgi:pyruvate/2-oxoglutarate dehydrogenase complex dihydrolipoamide acyltransferase (E2) component